MGILSSIGNAIGGIFKTVSPILSAVGGIAPIVGAGIQYASATDANAATAERLEQQQQYNVSNAASANAFTERMFDRSASVNSQFMDKQHNQNLELVNAAKEENRFLISQALDFEREMSGTAYQRAQADLKAAGLNPILLAQQPAASTPNAPVLSSPVGSSSSASVSGGSGAMASASVLPALEKLGPALNTALSVRSANQALENAKAQEAQLKASEKNLAMDTAKKVAEEQESRARTSLVRSQELTEWERAKNVSQDTRLKSAATGKTQTDELVSRANERIQRREAEDTEQFGTARLGREIAGIKHIIETLFEQIRR